jgi:hypothetical protein
MKQHSTAQHSTAQYVKWLLLAIVLVCSFFVPMESQKATAEGPARAGYLSTFNEQFSGYPSNWTVFRGRWTYGGGVVRGMGMAVNWG